MEKETFQDKYEMLAIFSAFFSLLLLLIAPIWLVKVTRNYHADFMRTALPEEGRHAYLFTAYKPEKQALRYPTIFFLRRYCMILTLVLMPNFKYAQILMQLHAAMYMIAYMGHVQPYLSNFINKQEIINEIVVWSAAYTLFCFSDFVWEIDQRIQIGWALVAYIMLNVFFNIGCLIYQACKMLKFKCKVFSVKMKISKIKKKHAKYLIEKAENDEAKKE